jgi:hypothetical protein
LLGKHYSELEDNFKAEVILIWLFIFETLEELFNVN